MRNFDTPAPNAEGAVCPNFLGDEAHLERIRTTDAHSWNEWRAANPVWPDLYTADLRGIDLSSRNLEHADLRLATMDGANLRQADLHNARLRGASLKDADMRDAILRAADFGEAEMEHGDGGFYYLSANLSGAKLTGADLRGARLTGAYLVYSQLVRVDLSAADVSRAEVYGAALWDLTLDNTIQRDIRVTRSDQPYLATDQLELAQFLYLIIENARLRDVLDTLSLKTVLILGRFTPERFACLNVVREAVRLTGRIPIVFDFEAPAGRDLTGTVEVLARLAQYIIADVSDPRSVPHELATIVPYLRSTPVLPLLDARTATYRMFDDLASYPWVLETRVYADQQALTVLLPSALDDALAKATELRHGPKG